MTRPTLPAAPWTSTRYPDGRISIDGKHSSLLAAVTKRLYQSEEERGTLAKAITALPDLLAALESALGSLQEAIVPLHNYGATGDAENCEESAALIKSVLTKAGYTFP